MARSYIGLATTEHDSAIAFVDAGGKVLFAEATERHLQSKMASGIPPDREHRTAQLMEKFCKPNTDIVVGFSWSEHRAAGRRQYLQNIAAADTALERMFGCVPDYAQERLARSRWMVKSSIAMDELSGEALEMDLRTLAGSGARKVLRRRYDHHLAHAASACFTSPFEEAVCAVIDGYGERGSYAFYRYQDGDLTLLGPPPEYTPGIESLGNFYSWVCDACGFDSLKGEEWKVMGLAAYGRHDEGLFRRFRDMACAEGVGLRRIPEERIFEQWKLLHELRRRPGVPALAAADMAYTAQEVFTSVLYDVLNRLYEIGGSRNLVLGGGCGLNSAANGGILANTPFDRLHLFSAPGDDGNAVGAALLAFREDHPDWCPTPCVQSPYLGSSMSAESVRNLQRFARIEGMRLCGDDAPEQAARLLAQGKIVGWIQGRAEFGPRSLGNRSILADPRSPGIKDRLNAQVKFREEFRPFAPAILHEFGAEYFDDYQESPYMERALRFKPAVRDKVPGVVHEDGTGRLQTVKKEWNERYHRLVRHFHALTGVPLVLNTSFNVMGKPISHSVEDVLGVFYTTGLDAVFIDDLLLLK